MNINIKTSFLLLCLLTAFPSYSQPKLQVVETRKIYDNNSYCAFTGLTEFNGKYYCTFREASDHHINFDDPTTWGRIVLLESENAKEWNKLAEFKKDSTDMRDPKVKITPDGKHLMLLYHQHKIFGRKQTGGNSVVRIFDGEIFDAEEQEIQVKGYDYLRTILWNSASRGNKQYGFITGPKCLFVSTKDGINYKVLADLTEWSKANNGVTESSVAFDGWKAYAVVRMTDDQGFFGESRYPFRNWQWSKMNISLAGPNLYVLDKNTLLLGSRDYGQDENKGKTVIYKLSKENWAKAVRIVVLNTTNDSSYPCLLKTSDNHLLVTYYSGSAKKNDIYISEIIVEK